MKWYETFSSRYIMIAVGVMVLDLIIKTIVANTLDWGAEDRVDFLDGLIIIAKIATVRMGAGHMGTQIDMLHITQLILQLLVVLFFVRVQRRLVPNVFKAGTAFVVFGWLGNLIDRLVFVNKYDSPGAYIQMDYLYFFGAFINLSWALTQIGWLILLFAVVTRFRDFRDLLKRDPKRFRY